MFDASVNSVVSDIMGKYDHNRNGAIDYKKEGMFKRDESSRYENNAWSDDDSVSLSTTRYTQDKLFSAADANGDGKATREELTNFISTNFDKNKDGTLDQRGFFGKLMSGFKKPDGELNVFNREYGERSFTNYVTIPTGNQKPVESDPFNGTPSYPGQKPIQADPFNKPSNHSGSVYQDPFSKPSNNKPSDITADPFNKPANHSGSVSADPFSKPASHSGSISADPFSKPSGKTSSVSSDPFSKK